MKSLKKFVALTSLTALLFSTSGNSLQAQSHCDDLGGCGYEDCCRAPCIAPAVALGAIALAAVIAVAVQNSSSSSHSHS